MDTAEKLIRKQLNNLLERADEIAQLQKLFEGVVSEQLHPHLKVAKISEGCLTLIADNASIATRLRFIEHDVISALKTISEFKTLEKIKCKVRPNKTIEKERTVERHISKSAAKIIMQTAEHIKDEKIRESLRNLAS